MSGSEQPTVSTRLTLRAPLAVVALPVLFVIFGIFIPAASILSVAPLLEILFSLLYALVGLATYLVHLRLAHSRSNRTAAGIREFFGVLFGVALAAWAILGRPVSALPLTPVFWIAEVSSLAVWGLIGHFYRQMSRREFFLAAVLRSAGPRSSSEAAAVMAAARDFGVEAGEAADGVRRFRRWLLFFLVWFILLLVVEVWALHIAPAVEQLGVSVSAVAALAGLLSLARMDEEQRFVMEGLLPSPEGASLATALSLPLFALCITASVVLASHPALFTQATLAAIAAWIAWLLSLIPSPEARAPASPPPQRPVVPQRPDLFHQFQMLPKSHDWEIVGKILTYLGWGLLALIAAGLVWLLVSPLFRMRYRRGGLTHLLRSLGRALAGAAANFAARLAGMIQSFLGVRSGELPLETAHDSRPGGRRRSSRRRRSGLLVALLGGPNRRFARAFLRFARWGEQHGVPFSRSTGPREYAELVGSSIPRLRMKAEQIASLYERHLFSPRPLDTNQVSTYFKKISEVVRSGRA